MEVFEWEQRFKYIDGRHFSMCQLIISLEFTSVKHLQFCMPWFPVRSLFASSNVFILGIIEII